MVNIIYKSAKIKSQKIDENEVANKLRLETDCDFSVVYN